MNLLIYITVPDEESARSLAKELVKKGAAAGVNVAGPIHSVYMWQGKITESKEWQLFAQTSRGAFEKLQAITLSLHPHVVPCIIGMPMECGYKPFLDWIGENCKGAE